MVVRCSAVEQTDGAAWQRPTDSDRAVGAALQDARRRAGLSRAEVIARAPGLTESTYTGLELGKQRVSIGALVGLCSLLGANPVSVLVAAGVAHLPIDLDEVVRLDPSLDDLGVQLVEAAVRSARAQAAERRQPAKGARRR